jgi:hypothetical protein
MLKTADQYDVWRSRVADACWAATAKDVFMLADDECTRAQQALEEAKAETKGSSASAGLSLPAPYTTTSTARSTTSRVV